METGHGFGLWKGLMIGSFLGAAAGFLLAPKSGNELRRGIRERANNALDETRHCYSDGRKKFRDTIACFAGIKEKASVSHIESPEEMTADA